MSKEPPITMNIEYHRQLHIKLHRKLDELVADFIAHGKGFPSKSTVLQLIEWSHKQTVNVDHHVIPARQESERRATDE